MNLLEQLENFKYFGITKQSLITNKHKKIKKNCWAFFVNYIVFKNYITEDNTKLNKNKFIPSLNEYINVQKFIQKENIRRKKTKNKI